jgi:hypothetical protein
VRLYDHTRLIPIDDRKRELIAARHTARVSRLYGTSETVPQEPAVLPVFLASDEVIGLIAYRRTTALNGPIPGAPPMFERWTSHLTGGSWDDRQYPLVQDMRLVLARVRWWQQRNRPGHAACPIRPLHPIARGHVRWAIRRHKRTAVGTICLLRADVRQWLRAREAHDLAIERATAILCGEIAAENIVAWGQPGTWRTRRFTRGSHEAIPPVFFANPHNTIQSDGWATCGWDASAQHWADWNGTDWGDVRFKRDDVLKLWPRDNEDAFTIGADAQVIAEDDKTSVAAALPILLDDTSRSTAEPRGLVATSMQFDSGYIYHGALLLMIAKRLPNCSIPTSCCTKRNCRP